MRYLQAAITEVAATILFENNGTRTSDLMRDMVTALGAVDWNVYKVRHPVCSTRLSLPVQSPSARVRNTFMCKQFFVDTTLAWSTTDGVDGCC